MRRLLLLPALLGAGALRAQSIRGTVVDTDGKPVPAATVALLRLSDSLPQKLALTDAAGSFALPVTAAGNVLLCASHVGYARSYARAAAEGGAQKLVLQRQQSTTLREVTVAVQRPLLEARPDRMVLNVEGTINSVGSTALDLLRRAPGVQVDHEDNLSLAGKSGVQVFIDGRPSPLSGTELAAYLASLQSAQIDAIELITNPSSRYEAAGNGGIINIRLKKNKAFGTNGSVNAGYGIGSFAKYNAGVSLNYRNQHVNLFGTYTWASGRNLITTDTYRQVGDSAFDQHFRRVITDRPHNLQAGLDYFLGRKSTIGLLLTALPGRQVIRNSGTTDIGAAGARPIKYLEGNSENTISRSNTSANLNYRYAASGREANIDLDYTNYNSNSDQWQPNVYYDEYHNQIAANSYHMIAPADIRMYAVRAAYDLDAWKGRLSAGGKLGYVSSDNNLDRYDVGSGGELFDSARSNTFRYHEQIGALFVRFQKEQERFSWQAGLRVEHTRADGRSLGYQNAGIFVPYDSAFVRSYTDLFPNISLQTKGGASQFGIAVGRRIDRPAYQDLNPFEFKVDAYVSRRGNTNLRPQYTDLVELTHIYRKRLVTQLSYSHVRDVFTQIFDTTERSKSFITRTNVARQDVVNLSINWSFQGKRANGFVNVNPGYIRYRSNFGKDRDLNLEAFSIVVKAQYGYKFSRGWAAEIAALYNDPGIALGFFEGTPNGSVDLAVSKNAFENRLTIKAAISDIFFTVVNRGTSYFAGQYMKVRRTFEPRLLRVNVAYRFGSNTVKAARARKTLLDEENKRLQTSN